MCNTIITLKEDEERCFDSTCKQFWFERCPDAAPHENVLVREIQQVAFIHCQYIHLETFASASHAVSSTACRYVLFHYWCHFILYFHSLHFCTREIFPWKLCLILATGSSISLWSIVSVSRLE